MAYVLYAILMLLLATVCLVAARLRARRLRAREVVQTLACIVSQNLPLPAALRAAAKGERGPLRRIYLRIAARLELGDPLSVAVRAAMISCSGHVVGAIQGAELGGTLPAVLQSLAADLRRRQHGTHSLAPPLWYPFILVFVAPLVVAYIMVNVVPKFVEIFLDFDVPLPSETRSLIAICSHLEDLGVLLAVIAVGAAILLVQTLVGRYLIVRVPGRFQPMYTLWDSVVWALPVLRHVTRSDALARQLPVLQAAVRAGHDLPEAARQAACVAVNYHARKRLLRWVEAMEAGTDPLDAAREVGHPAPLLRALASVREGADLGTRLEYLAGYYQGLAYHWRRVFAAAATPVLVVLWGLCVCFIALALFKPLVALIEGVEKTAY